MQLVDLPWPVVAALPKDTPIIFPVAAIEQHGHHLPVFTDSLLLGEVIRRITPRFEETALFAPLQWLGNSDHHLDFAGTLSASPRVYLDMLNGLAENFLHHGFRRFFFVNGHGGNDVPGRQAVFELRQRHRQLGDVLFLFGTYWSLGSRPWDADPAIVQREMGHACEWETSMMLRLAPHLVGDYKQAVPVAFGTPFTPAARGWITRERSEPGHIGRPRFATPDKGETLFRVFSDDVASMIERVIKWDGKSWNG
jgi:creatinine amidohydrolase